MLPGTRFYINLAKGNVTPTIILLTIIRTLSIKCLQDYFYSNYIEMTSSFAYIVRTSRSTNISLQVSEYIGLLFLVEYFCSTEISQTAERKAPSKTHNFPKFYQFVNANWSNRNINVRHLNTWVVVNLCKVLYCAVSKYYFVWALNGEHFYGKLSEFFGKFGFHDSVDIAEKFLQIFFAGNLNHFHIWWIEGDAKF